MPRLPHTHRNHPPITPHPKTVFLPDLSVCITPVALHKVTPVALHNRFTKLSTISEIPEIPNSPPPPPSSNSSPPPPHTITHPRVHTHTHMSQIHVRLPLLHSAEPITVTSHVHGNSYASLPYPPSKQTDAITELNNWMNHGSVCSNRSRSAEAETATTSPQ